MRDVYLQHRRALTLVELLASLAITAAVAAVLVASVRGLLVAAEWHRAIGDVRHLDATARIHARTDGPVLIATSADGREVRATRQSNSTSIASVEMPMGVVARILAGNGDASALLVDGSGRSEDATYLLAGVARAVRLPVGGLTGQHFAKVEAAP